ncbi:hypothetical protein C0991_007452, partial [Blastosporella zonata]
MSTARNAPERPGLRAGACRPYHQTFPGKPTSLDNTSELVFNSIRLNYIDFVSVEPVLDKIDYSGSVTQLRKNIGSGTGPNAYHLFQTPESLEAVSRKKDGGMSTGLRQMLTRLFDEKYAEYDQEFALLKRELGQVKQELGQVKQELGQVKQELGQVKQELGQVKQELGQVKQELGQVKQELGQVKQELGQVKQELGQVKQELGQVKQELGQVKGVTGRLEQELGKVKQELGQVKRKLASATKQRIADNKRYVNLKKKNQHLEGKIRKHSAALETLQKGFAELRTDSQDKHGQLEK